jgi:hypothetical protein
MRSLRQRAPLAAGAAAGRSRAESHFGPGRTSTAAGERCPRIDVIDAIAVLATGFRSWGAQGDRASCHRWKCGDDITGFVARDRLRQSVRTMSAWAGVANVPFSRGRRALSARSVAHGFSVGARGDSRVRDLRTQLSHASPTASASLPADWRPSGGCQAVRDRSPSESVEPARRARAGSRPIGAVPTVPSSESASDRNIPRAGGRPFRKRLARTRVPDAWSARRNVILQ